MMEQGEGIPTVAHLWFISLLEVDSFWLWIPILCSLSSVPVMLNLSESEKVEKRGNVKEVKNGYYKYYIREL